MCQIVSILIVSFFLQLWPFACLTWSAALLGLPLTLLLRRTREQSWPQLLSPERIIKTFCKQVQTISGMLVFLFSLATPVFKLTIKHALWNLCLGHGFSLDRYWTALCLAQLSWLAAFFFLQVRKCFYFLLSTCDCVGLNDFSWFTLHICPVSWWMASFWKSL